MFCLQSKISTWNHSLKPLLSYTFKISHKVNLLKLLIWQILPSTRIHSLFLNLTQKYKYCRFILLSILLILDLLQVKDIYPLNRRHLHCTCNLRLPSHISPSCGCCQTFQRDWNLKLWHQGMTFLMTACGVGLFNSLFVTDINQNIYATVGYIYMNI